MNRVCRIMSRWLSVSFVSGIVCDINWFDGDVASISR